MNAGLFVALYVILVDAVVNDIPFVLARYLQYAVVGSAVDFVLCVLYQYYGVFCTRYGA